MGIHRALVVIAVAGACSGQRPPDPIANRVAPATPTASVVLLFAMPQKELDEPSNPCGNPCGNPCVNPCANPCGNPCAPTFGDPCGNPCGGFSWCANPDGPCDEAAADGALRGALDRFVGRARGQLRAGVTLAGAGYTLVLPIRPVLDLGDHLLDHATRGWARSSLDRGLEEAIELLDRESTDRRVLVIVAPWELSIPVYPRQLAAVRISGVDAIYAGRRSNPTSRLGITEAIDADEKTLAAALGAIADRL